jgi:Protein of unknown function (DUF2817)
VLKSHLGSAARITIVDFHTGLGPHGYAEPIIHRRREDPGFVRTRSWIGAAATSIYGGGSVLPVRRQIKVSAQRVRAELEWVEADARNPLADEAPH